MLCLLAPCIGTYAAEGMFLRRETATTLPSPSDSLPVPRSAMSTQVHQESDLSYPVWLMEL